MTTTDPDQSPLARQSRRLADYRLTARLREQGAVSSVGDGIAWVSGLPSAAIDDILEFADGSRGLVFNLAAERIGAILLRQTPELTAGTVACVGRRRLTVGAGDGLLGRVVDPLGQALDGEGPIAAGTQRPLDLRSPPITARDFVRAPLYTGIKLIDSLVPIGKGQRQLLIGDPAVGRSALAIDAVINQRGSGVLCIYVLIGQKRSTVINTIELLREADAMAYSTVVVGAASSLPGLKYLAPFAGCAIAEHWLFQGRDTLIIYDDLTTHAHTYRELSLLLRRPPGREAYPGDIFFLHARLLERSTCLSKAEGGGSMTALPIVGTQQGELAAYIPTNLISITDGQIVLDANLFAGGFRPAIDISRSVSRIGGRAQHPRIKQEAGRMKLDYLQFLELEAFTRFGAHLEASMERRLQRGRVLRELFKQERLQPVAPAMQLAWMTAFNDGYFDAVPLASIAGISTQLESAVSSAQLSLDHGRADYLALLDRLRQDWPGSKPP